MTAKHTPGPWYGRPAHNPILIQGASEVGLEIAFAGGGGNPRREEYKANARLIAAAPDLLEALCLAHDHLALGWESLDGTPNAELAQIRAAIAKARGES